NCLDMAVFIIRGGQRLRLGMVSGLSSRILMVRPELIGYGTEVQFEVHPIGGRGNPITETISVRPGAVIHLLIPPSRAPQARRICFPYAPHPSMSLSSAPSPPLPTSVS